MIDELIVEPRLYGVARRSPKKLALRGPSKIAPKPRVWPFFTTTVATSPPWPKRTFSNQADEPASRKDLH